MEGEKLKMNCEDRQEGWTKGKGGATQPTERELCKHIKQTEAYKGEHRPTIDKT